MEIAGYIAALFIGISLGLTGGGGSILTIPVLVYLMNVNPYMATAYSLFIVGTSSLAGGFSAYSKRQVDFEAITEFGIPSIFSVFIARHYIAPVIPNQIYITANVEISRDRLLMLAFAVLMLISALLIIKDNSSDQSDDAMKKVRHDRVIQLVLSGLLVGLITGLLGAGGGFLIVPILVLYIKLPMKTAVGTSLMIIAINSLFGFLFSLKQFSPDWRILVIFSLVSIAGIFIGGRFSEKIPEEKIKKLFGYFVLVVAVGILARELIYSR